MRALIVYGTRYGSTAETSEEIAKILRDRGLEVDVVNAKKNKVGRLDDFDLFLVGSGIKMGKWTREPLQFLERNQDTLADRAVALFVSCASADDPDECDKGRSKYLDEVAGKYPGVRIVSKGLFGGEYDPDAGFMMRMVMRGMKEDLEKKGLNPDEAYDFRDWDAIRAWATKLGDMMLAEEGNLEENARSPAPEGSRK